MTAREQHIEDAARILSTYLIDATRGVRFDESDLRAELRTAVEHIVDAGLVTVAEAARETAGFVKLQPGEMDARD